MSRSPRDFVVYGFATTHEALAAEDALKAASVPALPIPTPRELGSLCGIALRLAPGDAPAGERAMSARGQHWTARAVITDV